MRNDSACFGSRKSLVRIQSPRLRNATFPAFSESGYSYWLPLASQLKEAFVFITKRGAVFYLYYEDSEGRGQKVSTDARTKSEALGFLRTFTPSNARTSPDVTLDTYVTEFCEHAATTYSAATIELFKRALHDFLTHTGNRPLSAITPRHVDEYKANRLGVVGPTTVNIELRALRSIFNTALRWNLV
jgi:hypothetical protein